MKSLLMMGAVALALSLLGSCQGPTRKADGGTYSCPSCKETVEYRYDSTKPWIKTGKQVTHDCPNCKRTWGANLSSASTCTDCGKDHLACPMCAQHK